MGEAPESLEHLPAEVGGLVSTITAQARASAMSSARRLVLGQEQATTQWLGQAQLGFAVYLQSTDDRRILFWRMRRGSREDVVELRLKLHLAAHEPLRFMPAIRHRIELPNFVLAGGAHPDDVRSLSIQLADGSKLSARGLGLGSSAWRWNSSSGQFYRDLPSAMLVLFIRTVSDWVESPNEFERSISTKTWGLNSEERESDLNRILGIVDTCITQAIRRSDVRLTSSIAASVAPHLHLDTATATGGLRIDYRTGDLLTKSSPRAVTYRLRVDHEWANDARVLTASLRPPDFLISGEHHQEFLAALHDGLVERDENELAATIARAPRTLFIRTARLDKNYDEDLVFVDTGRRLLLLEAAFSKPTGGTRTLARLGDTQQIDPSRSESIRLKPVRRMVPRLLSVLARWQTIANRGE